jgi:hypothetical protein
MASGSLEAWRCSRWRRHRTTGDRLGEWSSTRSGIIILAGSWVIDETSRITTILIELGPEVLVVCGLLAALALIEVLLVEGANPISTLFGVVSGVLWGQRAQSESHPAGIAAVIICRIQIVRFLWKFWMLVIVAWGIMLLYVFCAMDVDHRESGL